MLPYLPQPGVFGTDWTSRALQLQLQVFLVNRISDMGTAGRPSMFLVFILHTLSI